ncbi:hypothetical protein MUP50_00780, partial [Patescibacteria group bacterium]|nr:hypothetical protein [Patescibacteria group bacterium]
LTVDYTASGQTLTDTTYGHLTISGSIITGNSATVGGVFTVSGTFTPSAGSVITMNSGSSIVNSGTLTFQGLTIAASATVSTSASFSLAATLTVNASANFSPSGGTITMTGTGWSITKVGTLVFSGLTIDGTPSTQPTNDFSVSGALTINSGKTLAPTDGIITMTGGSIVNNGGLTTNLVFNNLTVSGTTTTASNFTINKTLNVSGSFSASTGIITMATTSWAITNSGTLTFSGLTISETPSVSGQPTSSFNIGGNLTINSGKNLAPTAGTITMTGTSWSITNPGSLTFYNWTVDGTASPQPTASFSVANTLTVNNGKDLSPTAGTITMTGGSIANSGTLNFYNLLVSGSTSTTSTFAISNDLTVDGTLTVGSGTGTITANGNVTGSGTMTLTAGTFQQVVATDKTFGSSSNANNWTFYNLKFNNSSEAAGRTITPNAGTGDIIIGASGTLTLGDSGTQTITFDNETANDRFFDINGNFSIGSQGIFSASSTKDFKLAGNYSNSGIFTANSGTVTFDATAISKTIEAGSSSFYDVIFNSGTGGWTIQTDNFTTTRNLTITDVSSLAIAASKTVEVDGTYSVADAEADDITWNSNSVLYLNSATPYTAGTKNQAAATYAILQIGANTDIRIWNSTAATFTVAASGSLYSQDHANSNGDLYIWGDYHTQTAENPDHDFWSYNNDFDGADISGSPRQVDVLIDPSSNVTIDSGDTLAAIGITSPNRTTVSRQGGSGGYGITVASGGIINFQYTDFDYLEGTTGLNIQSGATVTSLDYTDFDNLIGSAATDDAYITVASTVIGSDTKTITSVNFDESDVTVDFNVNRTGVDDTGYWDFDASTGTFDGEAYDGKDGSNEADPGMLRWDNSNQNPTAPTSLQTEGQTNPTNITDETPEFSAVYNDPNLNDIADAYQIQVDDDSDFGSPLWDSGAEIPMDNCNQGARCQDISYAGSALTHGTQYYWRIKYWDVGDLEGVWSTGSNYFIINNAPLSPTVLWTEGQSNPSAIHDTTPEFSAIYNDSDTSDIANFYQIQVDDDLAFGSPIWDSNKTALSPTCNQGNRCTDISYVGSALSQGVTYYWQIKYWDDGNLEGAWSTSSNYFTLSQTPTAPTDLLTEGTTNPVNIFDTTPEFSAIYNDLDTGDTANAYQIQVDNNQDFGSPIWDSGQQSMTDCLQGNRCQDISYAGSALTEGTQYYWQIKYWDDGSLEGAWNSETAYFIINSTPLAPDSLLTEDQTNPTDVSDTTPEFSAVYNDSNTSDIANKYWIQVNTDPTFVGTPIWDSGEAGTSMTNCNQGSRCEDISYNGSTLAEQTRYYWRIKYWDDGDLEGAWSTEEAYFELAASTNQFRFRDIRLNDLRVKPAN